jgi:uncharacterized protein (DUF1697 family)
MATFISLLRGINVSGQKLIKMEALRLLYENSGFQNVTTYLQSGNVIFSGKEIDTNELEQKISRQIEKEFGFDVSVIVLSLDNLKRILDNNPFIKEINKDQAFLYVTFLSSKPDHYDPEIIENKIQNEEEISFSDNAVFLYCPNGYGRTKLTNNFLEARLHVSATTRNWKTTGELLKIAEQTIQLI